VIRQKPISPGKVAWNKFRRNPLAVAGSVFICLICLVSIIGPFIRPDKTVHANDQHLNIALRKPGFTVDVVRIKKPDFIKSTFWKTWMDGGRANEYESIAIDHFAIKGDSVLVWPYNALNDQVFLFALNQLVINEDQNGISNFVFREKFILGTDKYGRDLLSRLMAGSFISLAVGFIAVLISLLVGLTVGLLAGYFRGWVDALLMWFTNVIWSVPTLIMVMAITLIFGSGFWKVFLAVGLTMWVEVARISRGQVMGIREKEYIEAARALGFKEWRIIFRHILPNIMGPVIVISAANFASAILIEAGLSFMGLGAQIPTPSWGNMIKEHYSFITTDMAYLAIIPGLCIMLLVLAFMMVGSGLRDALDTRLK
jgi:peptide/nickel transport system permease protein